MIDLAAGFAVVAAALDRADVRYVIVGSMAAPEPSLVRSTLRVEVCLADLDRCRP